MNYLYNCINSKELFACCAPRVRCVGWPDVSSLNSSIGCGGSWGFRGRVTLDPRTGSARKRIPSDSGRSGQGGAPTLDHVDVRREKSYEFSFLCDSLPLTRTFRRGSCRAFAARPPTSFGQENGSCHCGQCCFP